MSERGSSCWQPHDDMIGLDLKHADDLRALTDWLEYRPGGELGIVGGPSLASAAIDRSKILYSLPRVVDNWGALQRAFSARFPRFRAAFAVKACYVREVLQEIRRQDAYAEVMSIRELELAKRAGFEPGRIIANGVGYTTAYADAVVAQDLAVIVDNEHDLHTIAGAARRASRKVRVGLRVTPDDETTSRFIQRRGKLGSSPTSEFPRLVEAALADEWVDVKVLHGHVWSHCNNAREYGRSLRSLADIVLTLEQERGLRFEAIDIGGGLDTRYLLRAHACELEEFAKAAHEALAAVPYAFELWCEPGRLIVADAAVALTRVNGVKENGGQQWRITELGTNVLIPLPALAYHAIPLRWPSHGDWQLSSVGDGTCAPTVLCVDARLPAAPALAPLALLNVGAYTTVFAECWAFDLPDIAVWDGDRETVVFDAADQNAMWNSLHRI